jgi:hypothetical protein
MSTALDRDEGRDVPLRLGPEERILAVMTQPEDVIPADSLRTVPLGDLYPVGHGL